MVGCPAILPQAGGAKLEEGRQVVGGTVSSPDVDIYCAMANAGFDFLWIEMQHSPLTPGARQALGGAPSPGLPRGVAPIAGTE